MARKIGIAAIIGAILPGWWCWGWLLRWRGVEVMRAGLDTDIRTRGKPFTSVALPPALCALRWPKHPSTACPSTPPHHFIPDAEAERGQRGRSAFPEHSDPIQ